MVLQLVPQISTQAHIHVRLFCLLRYMGQYFFLRTNKNVSGPLCLLHGRPLYLSVQGADLVVAAIHRLMLGYCYGALLVAFNLILNLVIDLPQTAHPYLLTTVCVFVQFVQFVGDLPDSNNLGWQSFPLLFSCVSLFLTALLHIQNSQWQLLMYVYILCVLCVELYVHCKLLLCYTLTFSCFILAVSLIIH